MESVKKKKKEHDDEEEVIHIFGHPDKMPIPPPPLWSRARAPTRQVLHFLSLFISVHTDRHTYTYKHIDKSEKKRKNEKRKEEIISARSGSRGVPHHRPSSAIYSAWILHTYIYILSLFHLKVTNGIRVLFSSFSFFFSYQNRRREARRGLREHQTSCYQMNDLGKRYSLPTLTCHGPSLILSLFSFFSFLSPFWINAREQNRKFPFQKKIPFFYLLEFKDDSFIYHF